MCLPIVKAKIITLFLGVLIYIDIIHKMDIAHKRGKIKDFKQWYILYIPIKVANVNSKLIVESYVYIYNT